jgi:hypothetical protein
MSCLFQVVRRAAEVGKVDAISEPGESVGAVGAGKTCTAAAEVRARDADTTALKKSSLQAGRKREETHSAEMWTVKPRCGAVD